MCFDLEGVPSSMGDAAAPGDGFAGGSASQSAAAAQDAYGLLDQSANLGTVIS